MNNPRRIQFTNGNVTRYVYTVTGRKLKAVHQTAVPNITVAAGMSHELTAGELLYADSVEYLHDGRLTVRNGRIDKYHFDGGYAQATAAQTGSQADNFTFHYYTADHLGNIREVLSEDGTVEQVTNYYPFGTPYSAEDAATLSPTLQKRKYNGKEFDSMHGLSTYDYGARQYCALFARWDRMDPMCEKYYSVSPYVYCLGNPVRLVDSDGKEPGDFFFSLRDAAKDFSIFYNDNSIRTNREFASFAYEVKNSQGVIGYTYSIANIGTSDSSLPVKELGNVRTVASFHTHGAYTKEFGIGNNIFSGVTDGKSYVKDKRTVTRGNTDIGNANIRNLFSYVSTPNGSLQEYNPHTGKISIISNDMPSDPKDPTRLNLVTPIERHPNTISDIIRMNNNIRELLLNRTIKQ